MKNRYKLHSATSKLSMKARYLLMGTFSFIMAFANAQTIQIGSGTGTISAGSGIPVTNFDYTYSQQIISAAEYAAQGGVAGPISKIRYKFTNAGTVTNYDQWEVYIGHTAKTAFNSDTDWEPVGSLQQVFNGTITTPTNNNWFELTFSTPFNYTGGNIVVAVYEKKAGWLGSPTIQSYTSSANSGIYYRVDTNPIDIATPPSASGRTANVPQLQLEGTMAVCAGVPVAGTTVLSPTIGNMGSPISGSVTGGLLASGLTYQWQYSDDNGATWNPIAGQTNIGLSTTAMGTLGTRQYRRATTCTASSEVAYSTPATFTTAIVYCTPTYSYGCSGGSRLNGVLTTGAIANITNDLSGCNGGYTDNSATHFVRTYPGGSFEITAKVSNFSGGVKVWIDYNGNGTFEAGELVTASASTISSGGSHVATITVPGGTPIGTTRMRVRVVESTTSFDACSNYSYGEAEDYRVEIVSLPVSPAITQDGATPTCVTGATLSATGTPSANEAWYWQTSATGTSTTNDATTPWNVMVNGTYYVRAYNTLYNVWGDATSFTVSNIPVAPTPSAILASANPACITTGAELVVAPTIGAVNYWQGTNAMGTSMDNNADTPMTVNTPGTYYVKAYDTATECWSDAVGLAIAIDTYVPAAPTATPNQYNLCVGEASQMITANAPASGSATSAPVTATGSAMYAGTVTTSTISACPIPVSVNVPVGATITGVNVTYKMTAHSANATYMSEQRSYLRCVSPGGTAEATVASGVGSYSGTYTYNRSNLTLANGVTSTGVVNFELHAFKTYGSGETCGTTYNQVDPNTLVVTVNYMFPATTINWYDDATSNNNVGMGSPLEAIGTTVMPDGNTPGSYEFYAESASGGCVSTTRTLVTVNVDIVNVVLTPQAATCNNGNDGTFDLTTAACGVAPFEYSVDGGAYSATIPTDLFAGPHTVQVKDANGDLSAVYNIVIGGTAGPANVTVTSYSSDFATITWTATGAETSWNVEWGAPGFTPGTGTAVGSAVANAMTYTIAGLTPETEYDIYVSSNCGGPVADWAAATVETDCAPIVAQGYCEDFEDIDALGCWKVLDVNADGDRWSLYSGQANSGNQSLGINTDGNNGSNNDYIVLPRVTLTGNEIMTFHYKVRSASEPNNFEVVMSNTGFRPVDFTTVIMADTTVSNIAYESKSINLSQYVGNYYIAFHVPNGGLDGWILYVDDVCIDICIPTPGINGTQDVCRLDGSVQLNDVITSPYTTGQWSFPGNQSLVSGDTLNVSTLANGTHNIYYYVTTACTVDTTIAIINVFNPSSAGVNGVISACKNQMIDLYGGLSGNVDFGGTWYAPNGTAMAGSYFKTGNLIGQQVYKYVVSNGVCDADTSEVTVNITNCDFMGVDAVSLLENVTVAPNPNTGKFQIMNIPGADYVYEVVDVNGRVVRSAAKITSTTTDVNITDVENGVYMIRIYGNDAERMIRVIKH